ncbi:hypothetical protein BB558_003403, partial [Smittium angustum]
MPPKYKTMQSNSQNIIIKPNQTNGNSKISKNSGHSGSVTNNKSIKIDFSNFSMPLLRKYRQVYKLNIKARSSKEELAVAVNEHNAQLELDEVETIARFLLDINTKVHMDSRYKKMKLGYKKRSLGISSRMVRFLSFALLMLGITLLINPIISIYNDFNEYDEDMLSKNDFEKSVNVDRSFEPSKF